MKGQDEGVAALLEKTSAEWRVRTRSWFHRGGCRMLNEVASSQKYSTLLRYIQGSFLHTRA